MRQLTAMGRCSTASAMSGFPHHGWLSALNLPVKIMVGIFSACAAALILDYFSVVDLNVYGWEYTSQTVLLVSLLTGCLSISSIVGDWLSSMRKMTLLSERRKLRQGEAMEAFEDHKETVIKRFDHLSREEIHYIANCLRKNESSFLAWVNSSPVANLMAKGLVATPGGQHHQDHYPFYFRDFVWEALVERRDEFIEKDDEFERREKEAKKRELERYRR